METALIILGSVVATLAVLFFGVIICGWMIDEQRHMAAFEKIDAPN
jgi:hypothetical protein